MEFVAACIQMSTEYVDLFLKCPNLISFIWIIKTDVSLSLSLHASFVSQILILLDPIKWDM